MNKGLKILIGAVLSLSILFSGIGFAQLTDELSISGDASAPKAEGLFIGDVAKASGVGTLNSCSYVDTLLTSTVSLGNNRSNKITLDVTFYNNTQIDYMYSGLQTTDGAYTNITVTHTVTGMEAATNKKEGTVIKRGESLTAQLTFAYNSAGALDYSSLSSVIRFLFIPSSEYEGVEEILDALGRFKEILNTPTDRKTLLDSMDAKSDPTYIGNVAGASTTDTRVLNGLFTVVKDGEEINYLHFDFDGNGVIEEDEYVTIMVKAENVDNDTTTGITVVKEGWWSDTEYPGCEMTIYLVSATLGTNATPDEVNAFAATFRSTDKGESWEQVGELFAGKAETLAYSGWSGNDSIDTRTWVSTVEYNGKPAGSKLSTLIQSYLN